MKSITMNDLLELSIPQRIRLAQDLLGSVASAVASPTSILSAEEQKEINRRRDEYKKDPSKTRSWEEVKSSIRTSL